MSIVRDLKKFIKLTFGEPKEKTFPALVLEALEQQDKINKEMLEELDDCHLRRKNMACTISTLREENLRLKKAIAQANWSLYGAMTWASIWPNTNPEALVQAADEADRRLMGVSLEDWRPHTMPIEWLEQIK